MRSSRCLEKECYIVGLAQFSKYLKGILSQFLNRFGLIKLILRLMAENTYQNSKSNDIYYSRVNELILTQKMKIKGGF